MPRDMHYAVAIPSKFFEAAVYIDFLVNLGLLAVGVGEGWVVISGSSEPVGILLQGGARMLYFRCAERPLNGGAA